MCLPSSSEYIISYLALQLPIVIPCYSSPIYGQGWTRLWDTIFEAGFPSPLGLETVCNAQQLWNLELLPSVMEWPNGTNTDKRNTNIGGASDERRSTKKKLILNHKTRSATDCKHVQMGLCIELLARWAWAPKENPPRSVAGIPWILCAHEGWSCYTSFRRSRLIRDLGQRTDLLRGLFQFLYHVFYRHSGPTRSDIWCWAIGYFCGSGFVGYDMHADVSDLASI